MAFIAASTVRESPDVVELGMYASWHTPWFLCLTKFEHVGALAGKSIKFRQHHSHAGINMTCTQHNAEGSYLSLLVLSLL